MLGRVLTCVTFSTCARRRVRRRSVLCCSVPVSAVTFSTLTSLRLLALLATSILWQGCSGIMALSLLNRYALLAIRRWALLLCWYVTRRGCWCTCGAASLLWFAAVGATCATWRLLRPLSLLLLCMLLCLPCVLLLLSGSSPARQLLIVLV